jgi:hypothetical protein
MQSPYGSCHCMLLKNLPLFRSGFQLPTSNSERSSQSLPALRMNEQAGYTFVLKCIAYSNSK